MTWRAVFAKQAQNDARDLARDRLKEKAQLPLQVLAENRFRTPPRYKNRVGDLEGSCSRRINNQYRLVCQVVKGERAAKALRMGTHNEQPGPGSSLTTNRARPGFGFLL